MVSFPIRYEDTFYEEAVKQSEDLCKFAYWNGFVVGAICGRLQQKHGTKQLYIMTLAVLAPYRGRTIGKQLLQSLLDYAATNSDLNEILLHVHVDNADALQFYKKFGFEQGEMIQNYYKHVDPPHCYPLVKKLA